MKKEHEEIIEICLNARCSADEDEAMLLRDLLERALKYTRFRVEWNFYTPAERDGNNDYRTSCHNSFIDALNIFLRYERRIHENLAIPDLTGYDRKEIGDIANELVCQFAIAMR